MDKIRKRIAFLREKYAKKEDNPLDLFTSVNSASSDLLDSLAAIKTAIAICEEIGASDLSGTLQGLFGDLMKTYRRFSDFQASAAQKITPSQFGEPEEKIEEEIEEKLEEEEEVIEPSPPPPPPPPAPAPV